MGAARLFYVVVAKKRYEVIPSSGINEDEAAREARADDPDVIEITEVFCEEEDAEKRVVELERGE